MVLTNIAVSPDFGIGEQNTNERNTSESDGFTRSEAQDCLLGHDETPATENPENFRIVSDTTPSARLRRGSNNMLESGSSTAGARLKDYSPNILWNSIWLHKAVLIGFCALFVALFIALILLYHFSRVNQGLSVQTSTNKYSWKYGPTAGESPLSLDRVKYSVDLGQFSLLSSAYGDN